MWETCRLREAPRRYRANSRSRWCSGASAASIGILRRSPVDRKSTRLNSSHLVISYAVFCLKKKPQQTKPPRPTPPTHSAARPPTRPRGAQRSRLGPWRQCRPDRRHDSAVVAFFFFKNDGTPPSSLSPPPPPFSP